MLYGTIMGSKVKKQLQAKKDGLVAFSSGRLVSITNLPSQARKKDIMSLTGQTSGADLPDPLLDVQGLADARGIDLNWVGIQNVEIPVTVLEKNGGTQVVSAVAGLSVGLGKEHKGTHMSRFIEQLSEWSKAHVLTLDLKEFLEDTKRRLKAPSARLVLDFRYFIEKAAPATGQKAPMAYGCRFEGHINQKNQYTLALNVTVPCTTLCPCSKEISDFGAHNQRTEIRANVLIDETHSQEHRVVWIEDLIAGLEQCSSCPVYPLLKRPDEKYVTEWAYTHPKFVEDVIRESTLFLRNFEGVSGFSLEVEAFESIHAHNAFARHQENFPPS